jgi:tripartite-type tricarboxylate transporter receptor subunit TctC
MTYSKIIKAVLTLSGMVLGMCGIAQAQTWPARPITMVVPFAAGGSTDITARMLAEKLAGILGQNVVVENKTGAGGNIGAAAVARSTPDGYTILLHTSTLTANVSL